MIGLMVMGWAGCSTEFRIASEEVPEPWETADVYEQASPPASDVLFVVDNSESMAEEQERLATNFPDFLGWFEESEVDYHIGVISTDLEDDRQSGLLRESEEALWIERSTPDAATVFGEMTRLGTDGSSEERGREAVFTALELRGALNAGFRRPDALLNVIVVSDEDDQSTDERISRPEFVTWLRETQSDARPATFSAIVGPASRDDSRGCGVRPGIEYLEVVDAVGGVTWSICDEDWLPLIDELGFVSIGLRRQFGLSHTPDPETVTVTIDEGAGPVEVPAADWTWDAETGAVLFLGDPPPIGSEVVIGYLTYDER